MLHLKTHLQNYRKYSIGMQHLLVLLAESGFSKATSNFRHPLWESTKKKKKPHTKPPWLSEGAQNNLQVKKTTSKTVSNKIFKHNGRWSKGPLHCLTPHLIPKREFHCRKGNVSLSSPILNHSLQKPPSLAFRPHQLTFCSTLHLVILILTHC